MLRCAHDPRGDASTTLPEHIVRILRTCAKKVFNTQYMRVRKPVHCKFAFRNGIMPVVPRNWCLQLLLQADLPLEVLDFDAAPRTGVEEVADRLKHNSLATPMKQLPGGPQKAPQPNSNLPKLPKLPLPSPCMWWTTCGLL